jgi:hypothetical protein
MLVKLSLQMKWDTLFLYSRELCSPDPLVSRLFTALRQNIQKLTLL